MCWIEERVYFDAEGQRRTYEETSLCDNAPYNRLCPDMRMKKAEHLSIPSRDGTSSPSSYNPPTPTGIGSYVLEEREPASLGRRSSTRDKRRYIKPEFIITIGSKKDKSKKYPSSSKAYKRSSLGAVSIGSSDMAVESPASDASYTLRTGFPEAPVPPTGSPYGTRPTVPQGHRSNNSASSFTTSSQPPSLYAHSEPDSPSSQRGPRYHPPIVHNPPSGFHPPISPTVTSGPAPPSPNPYRTTLVVPKDSTENVGVDGVFPIDYSDFRRHTSPSHADTGRAAAPEITDRDEERARQRKARADADKKRQEKVDYDMAKAIAQEEETKQVRFELGRADARAKERAENAYAQREKRRAEEREELRRQKQEELNRRAEEEIKMQKQQEHERAAKTAKKAADRLQEDIARKEREVQEAEARLREKPERRRQSRLPTRDPTKRHRRSSMSQHDANERDRLLAETKAQMAIEREAAERREREEQAELLRQQQEQPRYWDPRGGSRIPLTNVNTGMGRRNSVTGRRGSISAAALPQPPTGVGRHKVSIVQPSPPALNNYPPPLLSPVDVQPAHTRPPSARHSSYDNSFVQPPTQAPNTSQDNPFAQPGATLDPWDVRSMGEALPRGIVPPHHIRQTSDDRYYQTLRRRGEDVIERAAEGNFRHHDRARQATRTMDMALGSEQDHGIGEGETERAGYHRDGRKKGKRRI